jgi:hypothetical protein
MDRAGRTKELRGRRKTMSFRVMNCTATTNSITITFSDTVLGGQSSHRALNLANYALFARNSVDFATSPPATIDYVNTNQAAGSNFKVAMTPTTINKANDGIVFTFTPSSGKNEFESEDFVHVVVSNVLSSTNDPLDGGTAISGGEVQGRIRRITRDVEDAVSYPVLTEEIGYRPSPVGAPAGGGFPGGGGGNLGQIAAKTVSDVLGWKTNAADPKGFVGALTQAFTLTDVEGHVESTWTPRTYAVQTDLGGGITGAQASLYMRAKNALDSALPLLDGLYPLDPEADPEYVKALREMARSQMTEIVKEFGVVGLPSILRIDTYFKILLGQNPADVASPGVEFDPDLVRGTLGQLRDTYGIQFLGNKFNNSVEDEQDITNFRVISDYMTSLMQSWISNRNFFVLGTKQPAFFGTQLVLISRQFTTIAETVNEVRFALDSVFIGPNERQALLLEFTDATLAPMFLEDVLNEIEEFSGDEGPRLLRYGGKISVTNNILPVVQSLVKMITGAHAPLNIDDLPDGFKTARVRNSLDDLQDQLEALIVLIEQVEQQVPPSENEASIRGIQFSPGNQVFSIFGNGFDPGAVITVNSTVTSPVIVSTTFYSAQRVDASIAPQSWGSLPQGSHDVTITNPDGGSDTLFDAFSVDSNGNVTAADSLAAVGKAGLTAKIGKAGLTAKIGKAGLAAKKGQPGSKRRFSGISIAGGTPSKPPSSTPIATSVPDTSALKSSVDALEKGRQDLQKELRKTQQDLAEKFEKVMELLEAKNKDHRSKTKKD